MRHGLATEQRRAARPKDRAPEVRHTFYVAPGGSDAARGSRRHPFGTLDHALRRLRYGQRLYVRGGTYRERVKLRAAPGRRDARVRVRNFPGERPVLSGQLWIGDPSYWTIHGLNVVCGGRKPERNARAPLRRHRLVGSRAPRSGRAHSTRASRSTTARGINLGRFTVRRNCIHHTFADQRSRTRTTTCTCRDLNGARARTA